VEHVAGETKRSRLETDAEVRARLKASAAAWHYPHSSGDQLDEELRYWGLASRQFVDE
jgi:hypothetical protein